MVYLLRVAFYVYKLAKNEEKENKDSRSLLFGQLPNQV